MGQRVGMDILESAAGGPATPEPDGQTHQPRVQLETQLPGGDEKRQIDEQGHPALVPDPAEAANSSAVNGDQELSDGTPVADDLNSRWQAANTQRAQELARERQELGEQRTRLDAERLTLLQQPQPVQEPGREPLSFTERLERDNPGTLAAMEPAALGILNSLEKVIQDTNQPLQETVQRQSEELAALKQQQGAANQQQHVRDMKQEATQLQANHGAEMMKTFGPQIMAKMKEIPGLGVTDAFQIVAAGTLQQSAAKRAVQNAQKENQRHQDASIYEGGNAPSSPAIPQGKPGEPSEETARRLGLIP